MPSSAIVLAQHTPVHELTESLRAVALDDPLASVESHEVVEVVGQLPDGLLQSDVHPVHYVDTVTLGVCHVLRDEAAEA